MMHCEDEASLALSRRHHQSQNLDHARLRSGPSGASVTRHNLCG
jgi:hypothetical protein